jgi:hypothetical protein
MQMSHVTLGSPDLPTPLLAAVRINITMTYLRQSMQNAACSHTKAATNPGCSHSLVSPAQLKREVKDFQYLAIFLVGSQKQSCLRSTCGTFPRLLLSLPSTCSCTWRDPYANRVTPGSTVFTVIQSIGAYPLQLLFVAGTLDKTGGRGYKRTLVTALFT